MLREGLGCIRARYLSDKVVLLTGEDGVLFKDVFRVNKDALASLFEILRPWNETEPRGIKVVWLRCRGLPLHLWTYDYFQRIACMVEELVEVDKATLEWERLEFARLKVSC